MLEALERGALTRHVEVLVGNACPRQPPTWLWWVGSTGWWMTHWCRATCTRIHVLMWYTRYLSHHLIFLLEHELVCLRVPLSRESIWTRVGQGHAPTYQQMTVGFVHTMEFMVPLCYMRRECPLLMKFLTIREDDGHGRRHWVWPERNLRPCTMCVPLKGKHGRLENRFWFVAMCASVL
jgi:hypothetical protein